MLWRQLELLDGPIIPCDPRVTRGFPETFYEFVVSRLDEPSRVSAAEILRLPAYLVAQPGFDAAAHEAGIDPTALLDALEGLRFIERLALVDAAELRRLPQSLDP